MSIQPTLVLLPGMDGTGELFAPFIEALGPAAQVKVVRYPVDEPLGYAELQALARTAIPAEGPFVILGESFSGPIAISLAAAAGPRLRGVILCCTFARNPRPAFTGMGSLVKLLPMGLVPIGLVGHLLFGRSSTPALRAMLSKALLQVSPSVLRARLGAVLSVDVSAELAAITVPIRYLRALHDQLVPSAVAEAVARLNPLARVVDVDAPHCLLQVQPALAALIVGDFLQQVAVQSDRGTLQMTGRTTG